MYWTLGANATPYTSLSVNGVPQFQAANPAGGVPNGTTITQAWMNDVQGELINVLLTAGVAPAENTPTQVLQALEVLFTTTAAVNTLIASYSAARIGVVEAYAGSVVPANAAWANGQALSRTAYAALFARIGTTFGAGDGSTTFNVPDLRGRAVFGADTIGGTGAAGRLTSASMGATAALGVTGGSELLTSHSHGVTDPGHAHAFTALQAIAGGGSTGSPPFGSETTNTQSAVTGITIQSTGGGNSQNVPPAAVMNWIIWYG